MFTFYIYDENIIISGVSPFKLFLGGKMQANLSSQQFQAMTTHLDHCKSQFCFLSL